MIEAEIIRTVARSSALLAAALLAGVAPLVAQGTDTTSARSADTAASVQGYAPSAPEVSASKAEMAGVDQLAGTVIIPARSEAEVDQANRVAQQALARADSELTSATARRSKAQEAVQARQHDVAEMSAKINDADKEKRKADKKSLEAQKKALERRKDLGEQLKSLYDAEVDAASKGREAAIARQQALDLERMLVEKRSSRASSAVISELERQTLAAQKKATGLERDFAGKRDFVASKRLDLYRAYRDAKGQGT